jgi:nicotine blue oxidoreductase
MGSSFRRGVSAAAAEDNVLTALVDQPGLTPETVARLLSAHRPDRVTAAAYRGSDGILRRGHPLLLDVTLRAEAAESATGDAGARLFLQAHPDLIDLVDCSDQSCGEDLDTPAQLRLLD